MERRGDFVIFGPDEKGTIEHRSTALEDSVFLTVRWPSIKSDCHKSE